MNEWKGKADAYRPDLTERLSQLAHRQISSRSMQVQAAPICPELCIEDVPRWILIFFVVLWFVLCAPAAQAAGTMVWTIEISYQPGTPSEKDFFGTVSYPTKAQALAGMWALGNAVHFPDSSILTTETGLIAMNSNSVSYNYVPGNPPSTISSWTYYVDSILPGATPYSSQASALATITAAAVGGCAQFYGSSNCGGVTVAPSSGWIQYFPTPPFGTTPPALPWDAQDYTTYTITIPPDTANKLSHSASIYRGRTATCPAPFGNPSWSGTAPPSCGGGNSINGVITGTGSLNECPTNGSPPTQTGDPCDVSTGNFSQTESDYAEAGLNFKRYYHALTLESSHNMGVGWTHSYAAYLILNGTLPMGLLRPDGHQDALFRSSPGVFISMSGAGIHVQQSGSNWVAVLKDSSSEVYSSTGQLQQKVAPNGLVTTLSYNTSGQLVSVTGPFGHNLQFTYNNNGQIQQLIDPAGNAIGYAYDSRNNLISTTYQDTSVRQYLYEDSVLPNNLTGIIDENASRFLTVAYNDSTGAVASSEQAGGAQAVALTYSANGAVSTNALGEVDTFGFTSSPGYGPRVNSLSRNSLLQSFTVPPGSTDPQQRVTQSIDANSNVTKYAFDADHLTSKTEAFGTSQARTTGYQYLTTTSALPTLITEALRQTSYFYYAGTNNVHTKTVTDTTVTPNVSRTWTYTYYSNGQVQTVDGPRTDVSDITTYGYYSCTAGAQCGQINTVSTAATANAPSGLTTTFNTYNAHGQPLTITDPNGVVTTLAYDLRQRLTSRQIGTETTSYSYYPTGLLQTVTLPDTSTVTYGYDAAHRLTDMTDGVGNNLHYTLDAMGNRTNESTTDPSHTLSFTLSRVYNSLNELSQLIGAAGTAAVTTTFGYDNNGNQISANAPMSRNSSSLFDALNRLSQITDPASGITQISYDANDNVGSVNDPRTLLTSYSNNGFGQVSQLASPDTNTTSSTFDSAGNLKTTTDARGAVGTYTYDALNRPTQIQFIGPYGTIPNLTKSFTYDNCSFGVGRLCQRADQAGTTQWTYTAQGRIASRTEIDGNSPVAAGFYPGGTFTINYGYNAAGQRVSMQMPSGATVNYTYNGNNQVSALSVTINGTTTPILSNVTYEPFGPVRGWTWGNGATVVRAHNTDGNVSVISSNGLHLSFQYDNAQRITSITDLDTSSLSWSYGYDALDRLTSASDVSDSMGWTYDANGNRLTQTGNAPQIRNYTYNATNNQYQYSGGSWNEPYTDAAGNVEAIGCCTASYDAEDNFLGGVGLPEKTNGLRQHVATTDQITEQRKVYDDVGHLLGEYEFSPAEYSPPQLPMQETIWLGDTPVAVLMGQETYDGEWDATGFQQTLYYVHADHLNTPRRLTLPATNALAWRWDSDPFGVGQPNGQPAGSPIWLVYDLRFPGQVYDNYSGAYFNWNRDYDSANGRYLQSDPIGLRGGSYSTYDYVGGNPLSRVDRSGLFSLAFTVNWIPTTSVPGGYDGFTNSAVNHLRCPCSPTCENKWVLGKDGCSGTLEVDVRLLSTLDASGYAKAKSAEQQHVDDYQLGRRAIENEVSEKEGSLRRVSYPDETSCEIAAIQGITPILLRGQREIAKASSDTYDYPGGPHHH